MEKAKRTQSCCVLYQFLAQGKEVMEEAGPSFSQSKRRSMHDWGGNAGAQTLTQHLLWKVSVLGQGWVPISSFAFSVQEL